MKRWKPPTIALKPDLQTVLRFYKCRCGCPVSGRSHQAARAAIEEHWRYAQCVQIFDALDGKPSAIAEQKVG